MPTETLPADRSGTTPVAPRTHGRRALVLLAFAAWNWWLWGTRTWNLLTGDEQRTTAFIAVHLALYTVSIVVATVIGVIGWRMRGEARAGTSA